MHNVHHGEKESAYLRSGICELEGHQGRVQGAGCRVQVCAAMRTGVHAEKVTPRLFVEYRCTQRDSTERLHAESVKRMGGVVRG